MEDHNATNVKEDTTVYAYRTTVFNTTANASFNNFNDLNELYEDEIEDGLTVGEGYTLILVNQFTKNADNFGFKTLATISLNQRVDVNKIYREGITKVSANDIKFAKELGYKIKLIAQGDKNERRY